MRILRVELLTRAGLLEAAAQVISDMPALDETVLWPTWREWGDASIVQARLLARTGQPDAAIGRLERKAGLQQLKNDFSWRRTSPGRRHARNQIDR